MPRQYPQEFRDRGVRLVAEAREADPELSEYQAVGRVSRQLGRPKALRVMKDLGLRSGDPVPENSNELVSAV